MTLTKLLFWVLTSSVPVGAVIGCCGLPEQTRFGNQPGLNLLLRRNGLFPPLLEAARVAAGRSQGDDPAEDRVFSI